MTPETNVDELQLRERFAALEHPSEEPDWAEVLLLTGPAVPARGASRRRPLLALAAALALAATAAVVAVAVVGSGSDSAPAEEAASASATGEPLAPLPAGPPAEGQESMQSIMRVTLDEMIVQADLVFVGAVEAVGGSEQLAGPDPSLTTHRVRFRVERPLRGIGEGLVDITEFDNISVSSGIEYAAGDRYLVFGELLRLSGAEAPVLVPVGYMQGVYRMTGDDTAENEANGEVKLSELESRLAP